MYPRSLYVEIASLLETIRYCKNDPSKEVALDLAEERLEKLTKNYLPSGSGFDSGTSLDLDKSNDSRLVFATAFHHSNDSGYTVWTTHTVTVKASLAFGIDVCVGGRNRNDIKSYITEVFYNDLTRMVDAQGREVPFRGTGTSETQSCEGAV